MKNILQATVATAACAISTSAAFGAVYFYDIFYSTFYNQTSPLAPTDYVFNNFSARMIANPGDIGVATFESPLTSASELPEIAPGYFLSQFGFSDPADLLAAYPGGNYVFNIADGTLGAATGTIVRSEASYWCDEIPAFTESSFVAMQSVDSSSDFTAEFNTFSAPEPANLALTFLTIFDPSNNVVFNQYFSPSDGSRTIPGGTLQPGTVYRANLYFSSRVETASGDFGGSEQIAGFDRVTTAPLYTLLECVGDLNQDGFVDDSDFVIFVLAYNTLDCTDPTMEPGCPADFNRDGIVDDTDFTMFVPAYNDLLCP